MGPMGVMGLPGLNGRDLTLIETATTVVLGKAGKDIEFASQHVDKPNVMLSELVRDVAAIKRYLLERHLDAVMPCKDTNMLVLDYVKSP